MNVISNIAKKMVALATYISPTLGCQIIYFMKFHKKLNLKNPKEFNEKLMFLKLNYYNQDENVWKCADKYEMRKWCIDRGISEEHFPELIKVYDDPSQISFDELPNKFALKCTHGMGFNIICENKEQLDQKAALKSISKWHHTKFGYESAELHYTHIKPKIVCEKFIENNEGEFPIDYKIYCFHGEPKLILVCVERKKHYQTAFFNLNWERLHLRTTEAKQEIRRPQSLDEMLDIARKVSQTFPFVRVDFYEWNGRAILGEMTFTPAACLGKYTEEASLKLGSYINLDRVGEKNI